MIIVTFLLFFHLLFSAKRIRFITYSFIFFFSQCLISTSSVCRNFSIFNIMYASNALKELACVFCFFKKIIWGLSSAKLQPYAKDVRSIERGKRLLPYEVDVENNWLTLFHPLKYHNRLVLDHYLQTTVWEFLASGVIHLYYRTLCLCDPITCFIPISYI